MKPANHHNFYDSIRCLLFDLDDTLYPQDNGIWEKIGGRIDHFLVERMNISPGDVRALRSRLFHQYGTTLRGLQVEHEVDMDEYLQYVHDIPYEEFLTEDPELDRVLATLPQQKKVIFTNAHIPHAQKVLNILGVGHHFEKIVDIYALYPYCKPEVEAFHKALTTIDQQAEHCLLIDDNPNNLAVAQSLGMKTISIGKYRHNSSPHIEDIKAIVELLG